MIRRAVVDDAAAISQVHVRSWQTAYDGIVPGDYLDSLTETLDRRTKWFVNHISNDAVVYVVDHHGIVGFVMTGISEDGKAAELFAIYVDPEHWGHGHGHELLEAAETHLATLNFENTILWVFEGNERARRFYEAHGWKESNRSALLQVGGADLTEVRYERPL